MAKLQETSFMCTQPTTQGPKVQLNTGMQLPLSSAEQNELPYIGLELAWALHIYAQWIQVHEKQSIQLLWLPINTLS